MKTQTRTYDGILRFFDDVKDAFDYAKSDKTVWKISFGGVRLVKIIANDGDTAWYYQPMDEIVQEAMAEAESKAQSTLET